mmetsp:Transcript_14183/g.48052  ORF Transcript_14183/g.48052 Transcript_14183/m.48052 type:complete len:150 (-) Transcript_14183:247-696(-)
MPKVSALAQIEAKQHLDHLHALGLINRKRKAGEPIFELGGNDEPLGADTLRLHLVRHGQGFHNLLGDEYRKNGVAFSCVGDDLTENNLGTAPPHSLNRDSWPRWGPGRPGGPRGGRGSPARSGGPGAAPGPPPAPGRHPRPPSHRGPAP